jgi:hypothetical protein
MKGWRGVVAVATLGAALASAQPAHAGFLEDAGWGSLTVLTNVIYMPAKVTYSLLGGLTGGLAYALTGGDLQTAETVWVTTMGGTYVVTPRMLQGDDPIAFSGTPTSDTTANGDNGGSDQLQEQRLTDG